MPSHLPHRLSISAQLLTVMLLGLMAGFFATYSANVNLATLELDGPTYAQVQSAFNRQVRHAGFFVCFFGPLPLGLLALALAWSERSDAWWRLQALIVIAYGLGIVLFTHEVNLPLNAVTESWTPATLPPDWARVREAWNQANLWRSGLSLMLFAISLITLVLRLQCQPCRAQPQP